MKNESVDKKKSDKTKKRRYQKPKITAFGTVAQFTQATSLGKKKDGAGAPRNMKSCIAPLSVLEEHRYLLEDKACQEAFAKAISQTVKKGDVVMDLGTGSGLHAYFALKAGAKKVYAIESGPMIEVAKEVAKDNQLNKKIEFLYGDALEVDLPQKVDVIVTNIGFLNTLQTLHLVAKKHLKKSGKIIPGEAHLSFVPVNLPTLYEERVNFWDKKHFGLNFSALKKYASNQPQINHCTPQDFLATPQDFSGMSFLSDVGHYHWQTTFKANRDGVFHGLVGWYTFKLSDSFQMSTKPPLALHPKIWHQPFIPLKTPLAVKKGDVIKANLSFYINGSYEGPLWKWKISLGDKVIEQSSFDAIVLSKDILKKIELR